MGSSSAFARTSHLGQPPSAWHCTPAAFKAVIGSLAAEGISVDLARLTAPGGTLPATPGEALLTVHELIPVGGRDVPATLTGSRAGIDRQVRSLEVTEAIGGVIALALLAALARVLVLLDRAVIGGARIGGGDADVPGRRLTRAPHAGRRASGDRRAALARSAGAPGARRDRSPARA